MLDTIFSGLFSSASGSLTLTGFLVSILAALALGAALTLVYTFRADYSRGFVVTLALLPAIVAAVIMMVSGSLGAGVAVAGTFSLVRFRSAPGTAREICAIFLAMAVGLACGMGYPGFAALFALIMGAAAMLYALTGFGGRKNEELCRVMHITVPEDLDYSGVFDDIFEKYARNVRLQRIKTTNLGSLNRLTYDLTLLAPGTERAMIDELRCRNGNLEISSSTRAMDGREAL